VPDAGQRQRRVDLVGQEERVVLRGELAERTHLSSAAHVSGRVVRIAEQYGARARSQSVTDAVEREPAVRQRHLHDASAGLGDHREERRIDGRVDHDTRSRGCEHAQELCDADHHIRHGDDRPGIDLPLPTPLRERGERLVEAGALRVRVAEVARPDGCHEHLLDGWRDGEVHLSDVRRENVRREPAPLLAPA